MEEEEIEEEDDDDDGWCSVEVTSVSSESVGVSEVIWDMLAIIFESLISEGEAAGSKF